MTFDAETVWKIIGIVFAAGGLWNELRAIRKDLSRLESKQDKYNNLQGRVSSLEDKLPTLSGLPERVAKLEDSCANAHKRISEMHYRRRDD